MFFYGAFPQLIMVPTRFVLSSIVNGIHVVMDMCLQCAYLMP